MKYTFLNVDQGTEKVFFDLTVEDIFQVMQDQALVLVAIERRDD